MTPSPEPVVLLAFADDADAHLPMLRREREILSDRLLALESAGAIQLCDNPEISIRRLFDQIRAFDGRLALLHYGGHASGKGLRLSGEGEAGEFAHAGGLAQLLGGQPMLHLVVLNGCATRAQVTDLLAAGVPAVIATAVPVEDATATEFAEQFYTDLARGRTIRAAFKTARDFIATRYGAARTVEIHRGVHWGGETAAVEIGDVWSLTVAEGPAGDAALDWRLPVAEAAELPAPPDVGVVGAINARLRDDLAAALKAVGGGVGAAVTYAEDNDDDSGRKLAYAIVNAFPLPVGEPLRVLFLQDSADLARLGQIVRTYDMLTRLFADAALAQLWDAREANPDLRIDDAQRAALARFPTLTAETAATFDHLALAVAALSVLGDNGVEPLIHDSARILAELNDAKSTAAHARMEDVRRRLAAGLPPEEVAPLCADAAEQLGILLCDLSFIALYKQTTIRGIAVEKYRQPAPDFVHSAFDLDGVAVVPAEQRRTYHAAADTRSVILQLDRRRGGAFLNLTPLVIDENAFTGGSIPKLRVFSHHEGGRYVFRLVANPDDTLTLPDPRFPALDVVAKTFDAFMAKVFA